MSLKRMNEWCLKIRFDKYSNSYWGLPEIDDGYLWLYFGRYIVAIGFTHERTCG